MRLPRVRVRLWWLMLAVEVIGLLIGGEVMRRKRPQYLRLAEMHAAMQASDREQAEYFEYCAAENRRTAEIARAKAKELRNHTSSLFDFAQVEHQEQWAKREDGFADSNGAFARRFAESAASHVRLCDKYRRAARYPWLPVAPDPPPPYPPMPAPSAPPRAR